MANESKMNAETLMSVNHKAILGGMLGDICHDLNNHLSILSGILQILERKMEEDDPLYKYFEKLQVAYDKMVPLTTKTLKYARPRPENRPLKIELNTEIESVMDFYSFYWPKKNIEITMALGEDNPKVEIIPNKLSFVLISLMNFIQKVYLAHDCKTFNLETGNSPNPYVRLTAQGVPSADVAVEGAFAPFAEVTPKLKLELELSTVYMLLNKEGGSAKLEAENDGLAIQFDFAATT